MGILLAFAPFIAFALVDRFLGPTEGLVTGAIVATLLLARDRFVLAHKPKILEIGTVILFGGLALYAIFDRASWSVYGVRLAVDMGLLAIVLVSMAVRKPFTLQYARERVSPELWQSETFIRTNYVISAVWALAFLAIVVADILLLYAPELPPRIGVIVIIIALVAAFKFTSWYPEQQKAKVAR